MATTATVTRSKHVAALEASAVDTITVSSGVKFIEVTNRGTSGDIYFRVDGTAPTVAGDNSYFVGPGQSLKVPSGATSDVVKLISAGTPAYSVTGIK